MDDQLLIPTTPCGRLTARWECRPDAWGRMRPVLVWDTRAAVVPEPVQVEPLLLPTRTARPAVVAA